MNLNVWLNCEKCYQTDPGTTYRDPIVIRQRRSIDRDVEDQTLITTKGNEVLKKPTESFDDLDEKVRNLQKMLDELKDRISRIETSE